MENNKNEINRRKFIFTTVKGATVLATSGLMSSCSIFTDNNKEQVPKRLFGKTGMNVSILSFGGGSQFMRNENGEWEKHLETAIKKGINLFDTAPNYRIVGSAGKNALRSEERYGKILSPYRSKIYYMTKLDIGDDGKRHADQVRESVEGSLKSLNTDYIDVLLIHSINDKDSVGEIEKGVYKEMVKLKNEGIIKHIGFSSMDSAEKSRDLMENLDFDAVLLAMNPTKYRNFSEIALPVAKRKNIGVATIKVLRGLVGKDATAEELLEYIWTENHVASAMIGHYGLNVLKENIKLAINNGKENQLVLDKDALENRLVSYAGPHALVWARQGYKDAGITV
jgi:predicted aldo/keto reductase-like oxidoreductase